MPSPRSMPSPDAARASYSSAATSMWLIRVTCACCIPARRGFSGAKRAAYVRRFSAVKPVAVGDLIGDEYNACAALGLSQEARTIVVTPIQRDLFVGGACIVAAHARGLGASVDYFGIV